MNPACIGRRRLKIISILECNWLNGPTLVQNEEERPKKFNIKNAEVEEVIEETRIKVTIIETLAD